MESSAKLTATQIYTLSQNKKPSKGKESCHFCSSPCDLSLVHNEPKADIGTKRTYLAKMPGSPYTCLGCWLFRRPRLTIRFLDKTYIDGKCPIDWSWFITETEALSFKSINMSPFVYKILLNPPLKFVLAIVEDSIKNHPQLMVSNDLESIEKDTKLNYTFNGRHFVYTIYELEQALRHGTQGIEPGVQELVRRFGPHQLPAEEEDSIEGPGRRPPMEDAKALKKVVVKGKQ